jgi:glutamate synthase (ferredoxin)
LDEHKQFEANCNKEMVGLVALDDPEEAELVLKLIGRHAELTGSTRAKAIVSKWAEMKPLFVKVIPHDYRRVLEAQKLMRSKGMSVEEAEMAAFQMNAK